MMMRSISRAVVFVFLAVATSFGIGSNAVLAADVFVNNLAGNDELSGLAEVSNSDGNGPVRSLECALRLAKHGDRVILANTGEPYRECVTIFGYDNSGVEDRPFRIIGNGAVLDGSAELTGEDWEYYRDDVFRFSPRRKAHQRLFRDGKPLVERASDRQADAPVQLEPLEWTVHHGSIYFRVEADKAPSLYNLSYASQMTGLTVFRAEHVVIEDLVVQGYQLDGIQVHDLARNIELVSLISQGNGRAGIVISGASRVRIESCLVGHNGRAQVQAQGHSISNLLNCELLEETAPAIVVRGGRVFVDGKPFPAK